MIDDRRLTNRKNFRRAARSLHQFERLPGEASASSRGFAMADGETPDSNVVLAMRSRRAT